MSIKRWAFVSLTAAVLASCMASGPVLAKITEKDVAQCNALGNLTIHAMEYKAKGVPIEAPIAKAKELFEGEELKRVLHAIHAGYSAHEGVGFASKELKIAVATKVFDKCIIDTGLSKA